MGIESVTPPMPTRQFREELQTAWLRGEAVKLIRHSELKELARTLNNRQPTTQSES